MSLRNTVAVVLAAVALSACGEGGKGGSQTLAKVNGDEVTVHQVNFDLANQQLPKTIPPEQAQKMALERLINQTLLTQKATDAKLDRDPQVMLAIERAKNIILAQAYMERLTKNLPEPKPADISDYYNKHPELFSQRKIYQIHEVMIGKSMSKEQVDEQLAKTPMLKDLVEQLKAQNVPVQQGIETKSADQLPMEMVPKVAAMKAGDTVVFTGPNTLVLHLLASKEAPLTQEQAGPAIKNFLLTQARNKAAQEEIARLRKEGKIEYQGKAAAEPADKAKK